MTSSAKLLGWTYGEIPGMGHIVQVGGQARSAGCGTSTGPNTPPGRRPYIGVMVKVESADATAAKVNALGGEAKAPVRHHGPGRMAVCFDPDGAEFDVWQAREGAGHRRDARLHGAPSWFERMTNDVEGATKFYAALFGWTPETSAMPGDRLHHLQAGRRVRRGHDGDHAGDGGR